jgi:pyruvate ferredoxin oxidoreductase gamma subunit
MLLKAIDVCQGLKPNGYLLVNSHRSLADLRLDAIAKQLPAGRVLTVPASELALKHVGRPLPNAALLGAFARLTNLIQLKSVAAAIRDAFPEKVAAANIAAATAAYAAVASIHAAA